MSTQTSPATGLDQANDLAGLMETGNVSLFPEQVVRYEN
jgi:hypothetical protein